ncbi:hypothetical protein KY360_05680 [Candidatus Woesearchaeota archaeon]|nr:hypothetical protein [Candidatus Woesearchaeota archaeon]
MSSIPLIIGVAVFVIAISIIFSLVKSVMKIIFLVLSITTILSVIFGAFVILDLKDFRENFPTGEKKLILEDEGNIIAGLLMKGEEEPIFLSQEQISAYSGYLKEKDFDAILGGSYKLMVLNMDIFENPPKDTIEIDDEDLTSDFLISVLNSEEPKSLMEEEIGKGIELDETELKGAIFGLMFNEVMQSPIYFFKQYKNGNILIYPETAIFKAIKYIPLGFVKSAMQKVMSKVEEKIDI